MRSLFFLVGITCAVFVAVSIGYAKDDDVVFPQGYKAVPADEALNQWAFDMQVGAFESSSSALPRSQWKNLYLAFAVEARYQRECFASARSVLCRFLRSGIQLSTNLTWTNGVHESSPNRYNVVLIPLEYVTGSFGKQGPDVKLTSGALFATVGGISEYLRDLGLGIQNRVGGAINGSLNYSSAQQPLGMTTAFRWIGSVRVFVGGGASQVASDDAMRGSVYGGLETQVGLALDLERGGVAFTNSTRHESEWNPTGGPNLAINSDRIELKYLHSICHVEDQRGCALPRAVNFGGGLRYEYLSASFDGPLDARIDRSVHRLIFFAEIARF